MLKSGQTALAVECKVWVKRDWQLTSSGLRTQSSLAHTPLVTTWDIAVWGAGGSKPAWGLKGVKTTVVSPNPYSQRLLCWRVPEAPSPVESFLHSLFFSVFYHFIARLVMGLWERAGGAQGGLGVEAGVWCFSMGPTVRPCVGRVLKGSYLPPQATALRMPKALAGSSGTGQALGSLFSQPGSGQMFATTGPRPCPYCVCSPVTRTEPDQGVALRQDARRWGKAAEKSLK